MSDNLSLSSVYGVPAWFYRKRPLLRCSRQNYKVCRTCKHFKRTQATNFVDGLIVARLFFQSGHHGLSPNTIMAIKRITESDFDDISRGMSRIHLNESD